MPKPFAPRKTGPSSLHRKPPGVHAPTTAQHYLGPVDDGLPVRKSGNWARVKLDYLAPTAVCQQQSARQ
jgi:hypothetical protein